MMARFGNGLDQGLQYVAYRGRFQLLECMRRFNSIYKKSFELLVTIMLHF